MLSKPRTSQRTRQPRVTARKVVVISFDPPAPKGEREEPLPLSERKGWGDPANMAQQFVQMLRRLSQGRLIYHIVKMYDMAMFPPLEDGSRYNLDTYNAALADDSKALRTEKGGYRMADYKSILADREMFFLADAGKVDEVWLFGGPYFGFYESRMVGSAPLWVNGPALQAPCKNMIVMGFNYERTIWQMLHAYGHRVENLLADKFDERKALHTAYNNASVAGLDMIAEGAFGLWLHQHGTVHTAPGHVGHYEYGATDHDTYMEQWFTSLDPKWWKHI
jgi:hypothetical protein